MTASEEVLWEVVEEINKCMRRRRDRGLPDIPPPPEKKRQQVRKCRASYR